MRRMILLRITILASLIAVTLLALTISLLMDSKEPRAVLLYTQKEKIPDIAFKLSSVPLDLASFFKFGSAKFAILPAKTKNIEHALKTAEFAVVGTHGLGGMISSDEKTLVGPQTTPNLKMRSIYFGSCHMGAKRKD